MRGEAAREKRPFKRNYDSGIWMGSEGTESSLEEEFLNDQKTIVTQEIFSYKGVELHAHADTASQPSATMLSKRMVGHDPDAILGASHQAAVEDAHLARARGLVQACLDAGVEDLDLS